MRTLLITGVDGFVGGHLAAAAVSRGVEVHGVGRAEAVPDRVAAQLASYASADLSRGWPSLPAVDGIVHLAGLAAVGPSFDRPQHYIEANSAIVTHMGEALMDAGYDGSLVVVSSGSVYAASGAPIDEDGPVSASSPYAVSKLLVEHQAEYYRHRGLRTVVARPFNHIGPYQRPGFLVPDLYAKMAALGPGEELVAGNLTTRRDYLDVRDVVAAYLDLAAAPAWSHPVYNVCSGVSRSGLEMLEAVAAAMGRGIPPLAARAEARPTDAPEITGSSARLRDELGWAPRFDVATSVGDFVEAADA